MNIIGIDFSGAKNPSLTTWLSRGIIKDNRLLIMECFSASDFGFSDRESC